MNEIVNQFKIKMIEEKLSLDDDKIALCKNEIINSYNTEEAISKVVSFKKINEKNEDDIKDTELIKIGYNHILSKECFIKGPCVDCSIMWSQYG